MKHIPLPFHMPNLPSISGVMPIPLWNLGNEVVNEYLEEMDRL